MAHISLVARFCILIACLVRISQSLEPISVSSEPEASSEVSIAAKDDRKNLFLYKMFVEKKPAQSAHHIPETGQDGSDMLFDSDLKSRMSFDDSEEEMQPGIWGKRSESRSEDDAHIEAKHGLSAMRKLRNPAIWRRHKYTEGQEPQMYSEITSKRGTPGIWGKRAERYEEIGKWALGVSVMRRVVQNMEETRRNQRDIFSMLKMLIRESGCPARKVTERGQRRQSVHEVLVKSAVSGSVRNAPRKGPLF